MTKENKENWEERFRKKFVQEIENEFPIVAFYDKKSRMYLHWNAYKLESFIHSLLQEQREEIKKVNRDKLEEALSSSFNILPNTEEGYINKFNHLVDHIRGIIKK